jgi:hypothetical protein
MSPTEPSELPLGVIEDLDYWGLEYTAAKLARWSDRHYYRFRRYLRVRRADLDPGNVLAETLSALGPRPGL